MGSKLDSTVKSLARSIKESKTSKTTAYDTRATVTRVSGDTIWVHIPGGVSETPVKKTMDAKKGDSIQIRVAKGTAWVVGNYTNPPAANPDKEEEPLYGGEVNVPPTIEKIITEYCYSTIENLSELEEDETFEDTMETEWLDHFPTSADLDSEDSEDDEEEDSEPDSEDDEEEDEEEEDDTYFVWKRIVTYMSDNTVMYGDPVRDYATPGSDAASIVKIQPQYTLCEANAIPVGGTFEDIQISGWFSHIPTTDDEGEQGDDYEPEVEYIFNDPNTDDPDDHDLTDFITDGEWDLENATQILTFKIDCDIDGEGGSAYSDYTLEDQGTEDARVVVNSSTFHPTSSAYIVYDWTYSRTPSEDDEEEEEETYIWMRYKTTYSNGKKTYSDPVFMPDYMVRFIIAEVKQYCLATAMVIPAGGSFDDIKATGSDWSEMLPDLQEDTYYWSRMVYYYSDGTVAYSDPVYDYAAKIAQEVIEAEVSIDNHFWSDSSGAYVGHVAGEKNQGSVLRAVSEGLLLTKNGNTMAAFTQSGMTLYGDIGNGREMLATYTNAGVAFNTSIPFTIGDPLGSCIKWYKDTSVSPNKWKIKIQADAIEMGGAPIPDPDDILIIGDVENWYLATDAATGVTKSTSGWTPTVQSMDSSKPYLWNYEVVKDSNGGTISSTDPVVIGRYGTDGQNGSNGSDGNDGRGISSIDEWYAKSSSNSNPPASSAWAKSPVPTLDSTNKYLWNYEVINYDDGSAPEETAKRVIGVYGDKGDPGDASYDLKANSYTITKDQNGNLSPTSITFTSYQGDTTKSAYFMIRSSTNGSSWTDKVTGTSLETSKSYTVASTDNFIKCDIYSDSAKTKLLDTLTVPILTDGTDGTPGANGYTVLLTNESHTFPAGVTYSTGGSTTTQVIAYKGTTRVSASITNTPSSSGFTITKSTTTYSNDTLTIKCGTGVSATSGTIDITVQVDGSTSVTKKFSWALANKGAKGDKGDPGDPGVLGNYMSWTTSRGLYIHNGYEVPSNSNSKGVLINKAGIFMFYNGTKFASFTSGRAQINSSSIELGGHVTFGNPSNTFVVTTHNLGGAEVAAGGGSADNTVAFSKSGGWYPLAPVGWDTNNRNGIINDLQITVRALGQCTVRYSWTNVGSSKITATFQVDILWVKAAEGIDVINTETGN